MVSEGSSSQWPSEGTAARTAENSHLALRAGGRLRTGNGMSLLKPQSLFPLTHIFEQATPPGLS